MLVPEIIEADMDMSGAGTTRPPAFVAGLRNPASPQRGFSLPAPIRESRKSSIARAIRPSPPERVGGLISAPAAEEHQGHQAAPHGQREDRTQAERDLSVLVHVGVIHAVGRLPTPDNAYSDQNQHGEQHYDDDDLTDTGLTHVAAPESLLPCNRTSRRSFPEEGNGMMERRLGP